MVVQVMEYNFCNLTTISSSFFQDLHQPTMKNQLPKNIGIGRSSLQDLHLNFLNKNKKDGFQNLGPNTNDIGGSYV